ncbi:unnamed protein product [Orchesella dallaii]|uniref:Alanine--glyoxylate aminotransferase n=1 Tax=Orchesella dallaii TaxID=48710 RepID=A0ABP1RYD7_9HEXA
MGISFHFSLAMIIIVIKNVSCLDTDLITTLNGTCKKTCSKKTEIINYFEPQCLKAPLQTESRLLASGGATNPYNRSFDSLRFPTMGMLEDGAVKIMSEVQDGIRHLLQTENDYTLVYHGTGTTGMTGVLDNMIEPGDKILVGEMGYWATVAVNIAKRLGANVIQMETSHGSRFSLSEIEAALQKHRPTILYLINGESSTGVYQPLEGIGELCYKYDCISIIDVVATVGQQPIKMDENKIDVVYFNSQKGCGGIVGLAPVSFSPRAIRKVRRRQTLPKIYQTDITEQADAWYITMSAEQRNEAFLHSFSMSLLYSLREGLARIVEEGIENVWYRHADTHRYLQFRAEKLGLEPYVRNPEDRLIGTTVFWAPKGKDAVKIEHYMLEKFNIAISAGLFVDVGKVIRIGLFGNNANRVAATKVMDALEIALHATETNV